MKIVNNDDFEPKTHEDAAVENADTEVAGEESDLAKKHREDLAEFDDLDI